MPAPPPNTPSSSYRRPASIASPVRNRWGVGRLTGKPGEVYIGSLAGSGNKNVALSVFDSPGAFASLSPAARAKLYRDAQFAYGYDNVAINNMDSFLATTARNAYAVQQTTGLLVDPLTYWDYFRQTGGVGAKQQSAGTTGAGGGGVSRSTSVTESIDISNPTSARALVDRALTEYLGRRATGNEYASFRQALNAAERKAPSRTKSSSVSSRGGGGASTMTRTMSEGGIDRGRFAEEWAMSQEGAAEYAAATTVLDTFMKMLGE